ncbi:hypothetical protein Cni_G06024 [Canna indica]|uniref:Zinc knuckle CX2CX4HX4C domain-containing protein n=1 Tax=Canna indica TaxID=4628 RepID=A0AAQ3JYX8_9LILI|nr:hypothetical protein Cni_G06024 [Canna indica]
MKLPVPQDSARQEGSMANALSVISEGPWAFRGELLILRPWRPDFQALTEELNSVPVWVQLPDLPLEYWNENYLFNIACLIGRPLKIDENSFAWERGKFVRICIVLNFSMPVKQGILIGKPGKGLFQCIRYERLPTFCFHCGCLGHKISSCSQKKNSEVGNVSGLNPASDNATLHDNFKSVSNNSDTIAMNVDETNAPVAFIYGHWIRVNRRNRKPRNFKGNVDEKISLVEGDEGFPLRLKTRIERMWSTVTSPRREDLINVPIQVSNQFVVPSNHSGNDNGAQFDTLINRVSPSLANLDLKGKDCYGYQCGGKS